MIEIRSVQPSDAERLLEIYAYYVENTAISFEWETPTLEEFRARIRRITEKYPYLVLARDGEIEGYAYAGALKTRAAYDWSCETSIYIDRDAHRCGYGKLLYEALLAALGRMGVCNCYACVAYPETEDAYLTTNSADFHAHLGFAEVGRFHKCGYKFGRWYDMLWMEKLIGAHTDCQPPLRSDRATP